MKIDGKTIAQDILKNLKTKIRSDPKTEPTLAVILIGQNPANLSYIKQKQKAAEAIGVNLILKQFPKTITEKKLREEVASLNMDQTINGIIVQRPLPPHINPAIIAQAIAQDKDVDGFHPNSPFTPPVAAAVLKILKQVHIVIATPTLRRGKQSPNFKSWLKSQNILILGRGETGGKPIASTLEKLGCHITIAHSKTPNTEELLKTADIIISCIGQPNFIKSKMIKKGAICLGVGISRTPVIASEAKQSTSKLVGDFDEPSISKVASFYTPTPGGIGPVNVACLMDNLLISWYNLTNKTKL